MEHERERAGGADRGWSSYGCSCPERLVRSDNEMIQHAFGVRGLWEKVP